MHVAAAATRGDLGARLVQWNRQVAFVVSFVLLVLVWRREHAANEAAFAARAEQRLATMKLQIELAKKKAK